MGGGFVGVSPVYTMLSFVTDDPITLNQSEANSELDMLQSKKNVFTKRKYLYLAHHHPIMHIKEPLLLIGKSSPCGGSGFPLSLSEWSFTIWLTPYNRK